MNKVFLIIAAIALSLTSCVREVSKAQIDAIKIAAEEAGYIPLAVRSLNERYIEVDGRDDKSGRIFQLTFIDGQLYRVKNP